MSDAVTERARQLLADLANVEAAIREAVTGLRDPNNVAFITTGEGTSRAHGIDRIKELRGLRDDILKELADLPVDSTYTINVGTNVLGFDVGEPFVT